MKIIISRSVSIIFLFILLLNAGCTGRAFFPFRIIYCFSFDIDDENTISNELTERQNKIISAIKEVCEENGYEFQGIRQERFLERQPIHVSEERLQQEPLISVYRFYNANLNIPGYYIPQRNKFIIKEEIALKERRQLFLSFISQLRSSLDTKEIRYTLEISKYNMSWLKGHTNFKNIDFFYEGTDHATEYSIEKNFE